LRIGRNASRCSGKDERLVRGDRTRARQKKECGKRVIARKKRVIRQWKERAAKSRQKRRLAGKIRVE